MPTKDKTVRGLAVGKGIADSYLLPDRRSVGIHPTYADTFPAVILRTYLDRWFVGVHPIYPDSSFMGIHPTFVDT